MTASRDEISEWFDRGKVLGNTHMVIICDTFDHSDYPVYTTSADEARLLADSPGEMEKIMEVYCLDAPKDIQLELDRCFRFFV